jgi:pimeloyl-ACP methyl ester carboxylesterase
MMHTLTLNTTRLAYLDTAAPGPTVLYLHGNFGRARMGARLMAALSPAWRVVALEQRGHGMSDKPGDYSREAYLADLAGAIEALGLAAVVLVGHSLGGLNAYQLAARRPDLVRAMVIEDIGAVCDDRNPTMPDWPERFPTLADLLAYFAPGMPDAGYFLESVVEFPDGWGFHFRGADMVASQEAVRGDWWGDWLGSTCPALLLNGAQSHILAPAHAAEMAARRPNTHLRTFPTCGHLIQQREPEACLQAVQAFLAAL